jgi:hypothetical protein
MSLHGLNTKERHGDECSKLQMMHVRVYGMKHNKIYNKLKFQKRPSTKTKICRGRTVGDNSGVSYQVPIKISKRKKKKKKKETIEMQT